MTSGARTTARRARHHRKTMSRKLAAGSAHEREQCKRGQPVFTHVVAGYMGNAGCQVPLRGVKRNGTPRVTIVPRMCQRAPAPRSAQVQSVEMRDFSIGAIAHRCGNEQRFRLALRNAWQETVEPGSKEVAI